MKTKIQRDTWTTAVEIGAALKRLINLNGLNNIFTECFPYCSLNTDAVSQTRRQDRYFCASFDFDSWENMC